LNFEKNGKVATRWYSTKSQEVWRR